MSAPDYLLKIKVNGVWQEMPHPMKFDPSEQDIQTSKSGRDERGQMWSQHVDTKWTYDVAYNNVSLQEVADVLNAIDSSDHIIDGMKKFEARVYNPKTMTFTDGWFYAGDRKMNIVQFMPDRANGKLMNLSFTLIEV